MDYSRNVSKEYIRKVLLAHTDKISNINVKDSSTVYMYFNKVATSEMAEKIILEKEANVVMRKIIHFCFSKKEFIKKIPFIGSKLIQIKEQKLYSQKNTIDVFPYLALHYSEFIPTMYKVFFNRTPDEGGLSSFIAMVKNGASNAALVYVFATSEEFPNNASIVNIKFYRKQYRKYINRSRIKRIPVIGRFVRLLSLPSQLSAFCDNYEYYNGKNAESLSLLFASIRQLNCDISMLNKKVSDAEWGIAANHKEITSINEKITICNSLYENLVKDLGYQIAENTDSMSYLTAKISDSNTVMKSSGQRIEKSLAEFCGKADNIIWNTIAISEKTDSVIQNTTAISEKTDNLYGFISQVSNKTKTSVLGIPGGVISVIAGDFIFGVPSEEWGLAHFLSLNGHFEPGTEDLFCKLLKPGMKVLDIGANLGMFTLHALNAGCEVYSFEPSPKIFNILNQNIKVNGFAECGRAHTYEAAVSDEEKNVSFFVCDGMSGHSNMFSPEKSADKEIVVKTMVIDKVFEYLDKVDIVKIDVEGAEYHVLCGMRKLMERSPDIKIIIEYAPDNMKKAGIEASDLISLIKDCGFSYYLINDNVGEITYVESDDLLKDYSVNLLLTKGNFNL